MLQVGPVIVCALANVAILVWTRIGPCVAPHFLRSDWWLLVFVFAAAVVLYPTIYKGWGRRCTSTQTVMVILFGMRAGNFVHWAARFFGSQMLCDRGVSVLGVLTCGLELYCVADVLAEHLVVSRTEEPKPKTPLRFVRVVVAADDTAKECIICMEPLGVPHAQLACNHRFHIQCAEQWHTAQRAGAESCPICRNPVDAPDV